MISKFFIDRPVFAAVLSIVIVLAGLVSMGALSIEQYPEIVPPEVVVEVTYPGASAEVIATTVATPLEQEINGVENMIYMRSSNSDAGSMRISVYFDIGTDPDQATIDVNNRVQAALPRLPQEVRDQGVTAQKRSSDQRYRRTQARLRRGRRAFVRCERLLHACLAQAGQDGRMRSHALGRGRGRRSTEFAVRRRQVWRRAHRRRSGFHLHGYYAGAVLGRLSVR